VLIEPIGLREIPDRPSWLIGGAAPDDGSACMGVKVLVGPLGDIAHKVEKAQGARALWESVHVCGWAHRAAAVGSRKCVRVPIIAPRIQPAIG
jgi:hypothetical protein